MKAVVIYEHGGVDKLSYDEVPDPTLTPSGVLVEVKACALNHLDVWVRRGLPHLKLSYPHVLGSDVAGVVREVGAEVDGIEPGTKVIVSPGITCGVCRWCLGGMDNLCRDYKILGENTPGGCAELVCVPKENIIPMPEGLAFEEAAALPLVFLTAWHMLVVRAGLRLGETVLVHAAGSGVGSAAVQIAKLHEATVIVTAGSEEKLQKARDVLGADHCINYRRQDFEREVKRITEGRGVDVIVDHVGDVNWDKNIRALTMGGRLVICGATAGWEGRTDLRHVFFRRLTLLGSTMGTKGDLWEVIRHVEAGRLKPVVHEVLPMSRARDGHLLLESRKVFGKVVLVPD